MSFNALYGAVHETLPSWHWTYSVIDALQDRGLINELSRIERPYLRGDIARALIQLSKNNDIDKVSIQSIEKSFLSKLSHEFESEIRYFQEHESVRSTVELGLHLREDVTKASDSSGRLKGVYRSRISAVIGEHATVFSGLKMDQYRLDDSLYTGKKWRGLVYSAEQAYFNAVWKHSRIQFGRDFLRLGTGQASTLLFSDVCDPIDRFMGSFDVGPFHFSFLAAFLDAIPYQNAEQDSFETSYIQRYLVAHRLKVKLWGGRLEAAVTEAASFGGINRPLEWTMANPFLFYHGEQLNNKNSANTFGMIDVSVFPTRRWQIYGSFLIDDIQVEKKTNGDLEPNEIGWITGLKWADPIGLKGFTVFSEYSGVTNRTYKTPSSWETLLFHNIPIGHPLGNDFDQWMIGGSQWINASLRVQLMYDRIRRGEGSIYTEWDTPWLTRTINEGYTEPFPTGIVETETAVSLSLDYRPRSQYGINAMMRSMRRSNENHFKGVSGTGTEWRIGLWVNWDTILRL